jgi:hypothetical protein
MDSSNLNGDRNAHKSWSNGTMEKTWTTRSTFNTYCRIVGISTSNHHLTLLGRFFLKPPRKYAKDIEDGLEITTFVSFDTETFADEHFANPKIKESEDIRYLVLGIEENYAQIFGLVLLRLNETDYFIRLGVFKSQGRLKDARERAFGFKKTLDRYLGNEVPIIIT